MIIIITTDDVIHIIFTDLEEKLMCCKKIAWGVSHKEMVGHNYSLDYSWQVWDLTNISVLTKTMLQLVLASVCFRLQNEHLL